MALKTFTWTSRGDYQILHIGSKRAGHVKVAQSEPIKPYLWVNDWTDESGHADDVVEGMDKLEKSIQQFYKEIHHEHAGDYSK